MNYYSTGTISGEVLHPYYLSDDSDFVGDIKAAKGIYVVSAFYNRDFLTAVCKAAAKKAKIEFILPRERGIEKQKHQRNLCSQLANSHKNLSILLVDSSYLLHTKLYIFDFGGEFATWIGSSNASTNSLERCEELMIRSKSTKWPDKLKEYYQVIKQSANFVTDFPELVLTRSIYDFLSQGNLYVKTAEAFNPTIELDFGYHRDAVIDMLAASSDDVTGLFVSTSTRVSLFKLLKRVSTFQHVSIDIDEKSDGSEGIKKFGLTTCFGLWVPDGYRHEVERILFDSPTARRRKDKLSRIYKLLLESQRREFIDLEDALKDILEGIASRIGVAVDTFYRTPDAKPHSNINRLTRKAASCLVRLSPEDGNKLFKLLINPYYSTTMPAIWDDDMAKSDFVETFCDSLTAEGEKKRVMNFLHQSIHHFSELDSIASVSGSSPESLLKDLLEADNGRWFSQYDLKGFYKLNESSEDFKMHSLAKISKVPPYTKQKGATLFLEDGDYLLRGEVAAIREDGKLVCTFEDGAVETFSQRSSKLYTTCVVS